LLREILARNLEEFNYRSFIIIKLQALLVLMLLFLFLRLAVDAVIVLAVEALLSAIYIFIFFSEVKREFPAELMRYGIFFLGVLAFVQAGGIMQFIGFAEAWHFFALIIGLAVFLVLFRMLFGRKYSPAKVLLSDGELAIAETQFDLLSFTNAGKHIVRTERKYAKGAEIRLKKIPLSRKYRVIE
ncbi:MAG: hypothetical protein ABH854_04180, partial [Candidatus Diapherotrites archaeon]